MTRWLTFAFLLFLTGCSEKCVQSGVEGVYTMTSGATEYKLQLLSGGGGTLSSANRQIGKLSWSFVSGPQDEMLELNASGEVFDALRQMRSTDSARPPNPSANGGAFETLPQCNRAGKLRKIVVQHETGLAFNRAE